MQQFKLFCYNDPIQKAHARDVTPWPVEGGDKANLYWIATNSENDWNSRCHRLGRERCRGSPNRDDHGHWVMGQIVCQGSQSIILTFCPTVFGRGVVPHDI